MAKLGHCVERKIRFKIKSKIRPQLSPGAWSLGLLLGLQIMKTLLWVKGCNLLPIKSFFGYVGNNRKILGGNLELVAKGNMSAVNLV